MSTTTIVLILLILAVALLAVAVIALGRAQALNAQSIRRLNRRLTDVERRRDSLSRALRERV